MRKILSLLLLFTIGNVSFALTYQMPDGDTDLIGSELSIKVHKGQKLEAIAKKYNVGYCEILAANKHLNSNIVNQTSKIIIPSAYLLPTPERNGVVINIPESRIYYFNQEEQLLATFPITIGREGWRTPTGETKIIEKVENPDWIVPQSIKSHALENGITLPDIVKAGPNNPLGAYKMRLDMPGYLIHGTNSEQSIGKAESSGCLRMYAKDLKWLFALINIGTSVNIINKPFKLGWVKEHLYLEAHKPLKEDVEKVDSWKSQLYTELKQLENQRQVTIDWLAAEQVLNDQLGRPAIIGTSPQEVTQELPAPLAISANMLMKHPDFTSKKYDYYS